MIVTLDVGNTNIVLGAFENDKLKFTARVATETLKMEDQYAIEFASIIKLNGYKPSQVDGAIISTVVPTLMPVLKHAMQKLFKCKVFVIGPGIKTGLNIKIDNPAALGADIVCGSVGALLKYTPPCIIFDLGTATTIAAINKNYELVGGSIMPGVRISLDALATRTSQLPQISLDMNNEYIMGTNTVDSMKSGVIIGAASMIDGMVDRYKEALGEEATVIATGGLAKGIIKHCRREVNIEEDLLLDGLYAIYKKNTID